MTKSFAVGRKAIVLAVLSSTAIAPAAWAQDAASAPAQADAPAEAAEAASGDIIVTAQRRSEKMREVPITMVAQTGADLAKAGVTNLRDIGSVAPGVAFTSQGPFAEPNIRGVSTTLSQAGAESPIAIYVDGVYQPNQIGNLFDLPDVRQVEVLKGPQGTLFGRNATGGAILIHTRDPEFNTAGNFEVSAGVFTGSGVKSSPHIASRGFITTPLVDDVLSVSLSGSYEYTPGYLTDVLTDQRTGTIRSHSVRGKILFKPAPGVKFLLSGYEGQRLDEASSVSATTGVSVATQYPDAVLATRPWQVASELRGSVQPVKTQSRGVSLKADIDIGNAGTLSSLTSYAYTNGTVLSEVDGAYSPSCVAVFACITPYVVEFGPSKTFQQEVTFTSNDFGAFHVTAGMLYFHDKSGLSSWVNPPLTNGGLSGDAPYGAPYYTSTYVKTKAWAGFGELTWNVTDALHVIGGVRYSWEQREGHGSVLTFPEVEFGNRPTWSSWTPRISVRYDVTPEANLYATYSKGFKSGVLNALNLSNDTANPETLESYEVGVKYGSSAASFNLSAFYYNYKDIQIQFFLGLANTIGNAARAKIYGLDFDGNVRLGSNFSVRAAASWVPHAEYSDYTNGVGFVGPMGPYGLQTVTIDASGSRLLKTPKFTGTLALNYDADLGNGDTLDANASLYYSSGFRWNLTDRVRTDRYATLGAQIGYSPAGSGARFAIYGRNLTNRAYVVATTLSAEGDTMGYSAPREIGVSIGYKF
ncbi:TonB-dependent receptor [Novosphingobium sp. KCTC 2891]|uniref:TonB-dependent receptor n=1 Tax=Novosphingobium sp. KCTC 2891 TaxID=2989730 RepID=UPI0022228C15|nr:TonB-dependent receptor [Novosphingobium sp. KCTC 2891]MCW1384692.1 TonB-dependent receptor [Novosphingobium sp. KCTC 2891]